MGKRKPECPRGVKYFECVPEGELLKHKVVKSILASTFVNQDYEFVFCVDGELVSRRYRRILMQRDDVAVCSPYNQLVTIHRKDGTSELGLVGVFYDNIVLRKELTSIYVHKIQNPKTGKWEWPGTLYDRAPDDRLGKILGYYNENMEAAVDQKDQTKVKYIAGDMADYRQIYALTHYENDWVTKCPQGTFPEIDMGRGVMFVATKHRYANPPLGYFKWEGCPPQFYTFKKAHYLKSVYKNVTRTVLRKELFSLDDLLMVKLIRPEDSNLTDVVWTSLDATCKGNV